MNLELDVKRNLFLHDVIGPDVIVSLNIPDISLNMSHLQYQLLWQTIYNNIKYGGGILPAGLVSLFKMNASYPS